MVKCMRSDDFVNKFLRLPTDICHGHCGNKYCSSVVFSFLLSSFVLYISDMISMNQLDVVRESLTLLGNMF